MSCQSTPSNQQMVVEEKIENTKGRILFIVSNAHYYGKSDINASNHFSEIVLPYDVLVKAGYTVDFVSPEGGAIPLGYLTTSDAIVKQYIYKDGKYLVKGKKVNGFPDKFENMKGRYYKEFPFSIEQIIEERGGDFTYSEEGWDGFFVVDGKIITGQDPTGAAMVATKVVEALEADKLKSLTIK